MSTNAGDGHYEVYWPRSPRQMKKKALAPRLSTLDGKTVVQLWDFLFQGDKVFDALEEGLKARYPGVKFVSWKEFGNTHGRDERQVLKDLPRRLKELGADAAISGMGC
jgi:hypothetical protein